MVPNTTFWGGGVVAGHRQQLTLVEEGLGEFGGVGAVDLGSQLEGVGEGLGRRLVVPDLLVADPSPSFGTPAGKGVARNAVLFTDNFESGGFEARSRAVTS